jgi:hypothetical protein
LAIKDIALTGLLILLGLVTLILAGTASKFYRQAEYARDTAETAERLAAEARQGVSLAQEARDEAFSFNQFFKHAVGMDSLAEPEYQIVRPLIAGDEEMALALRDFEADMAAINKALKPEEPIANYRDAVAACLAQHGDSADVSLP